MLKLTKTVSFIALVFCSALEPMTRASTSSEVTAPSVAPVKPADEVRSGENVTQTQSSQSKTLEEIKKRFGLTYFSFFYGPGLHPDLILKSPNQFGDNEKFGLYLKNNVSLRFKFSQDLAIDLQTRIMVYLNNSSGRANYQFANWEAPRIGISGKLLSGKDWSVTGAFNTDFPFFFPEPLSGFEVQQRKVLLNPGFFANFTWEPKGSRWSVFSVLSPRMFFYADRSAAEPNYIATYHDGRIKPEFILSLQPTINYTLSEKVSLSLGTTIDYRKLVLSSWNPFNGSLASNGDSPAWRLAPLNVFLGATFKVSPAFTIFPFIATYPITEQRIKITKSGDIVGPASLLETTSIGMWLRGTVF